jgi:PHD/YefM family antitoxin component YafN of YafNO toxin-antitoxin module
MSGLTPELQKIIDLIKKTGDKLVVLDGNGSSFAIMDLKDYERLVLGKSDVRGLTEDELLDKINRDIALWKADQEELDNNNDWSDFSLNLDKKKMRAEQLSSELESSDEDKYYFEPLE